MIGLSELGTDELADGICLRAGQIAAAEAEMMPWIAEFDRREGWAGTGMLSAAHWLSWKISLSLPTAREQVRVARRLEDLPVLAVAYAEGRISYSKVRAITRIAEPDDGIDWVEHARHSSAAQLEQLVRGVRRARASEAAAADPEATAWALRTRVRYDEHGHFTYTVSGPAELLPVIQAGIEAKKAELQRQRDAAAEEAAADVAREDASAEAPALGAATRPDTATEPEPKPEREPEPEPEPVDLDAQAVGWPSGTTVRDVRASMASFLLAREAERDQCGTAAAPTATATTDEAAAAPTSCTETPLSTEDVSAEAPAAAKVTDGEALLALAQDALVAEQSAHPAIARRRRPGLNVQIDPLSGWGRLADGELLPPSSLRAVMKSLPGRQGTVRLRPVTQLDLRRFDLGRTSREPSPALRELLGTVDGERCRFPGCTRRTKLHAHHVRFWSQGGATDLNNLVLVCARHHTLIHNQGFELVLPPDRRLQVHTADGVAIAHHPAQPWGDPAALVERCGQLVSAETLPPDHGTARLDLGYAISVLMAQAA